MESKCKDLVIGNVTRTGSTVSRSRARRRNILDFQRRSRFECLLEWYQTGSLFGVLSGRRTDHSKAWDDYERWILRKILGYPWDVRFIRQEEARHISDDEEFSDNENIMRKKNIPTLKNLPKMSEWETYPPEADNNCIKNYFLVFKV